MKDDLAERYSTIVDQALLDIIEKPEDYTPEAFRAAQAEMEQRGGLSAVAERAKARAKTESDAAVSRRNHETYRLTCPGDVVVFGGALATAFDDADDGGVLFLHDAHQALPLFSAIRKELEARGFPGQRKCWRCGQAASLDASAMVKTDWTKHPTPGNPGQVRYGQVVLPRCEQCKGIEETIEMRTKHRAIVPGILLALSLIVMAARQPSARAWFAYGGVIILLLVIYTVPQVRATRRVYAKHNMRTDAWVGHPSVRLWYTRQDHIQK